MGVGGGCWGAVYNWICGTFVPTVIQLYIMVIILCVRG